MNPTRTALTTLAAAALAAALAACGASSSGAATSTPSAAGASATGAPAAGATGAGSSMMGSDAASTPAMTSPAMTSPSAMAGMTGMAMRFNDQDVTFAADMIDHHRQAVQMAKLAPGRTATTAVLALARDIAGAQGPEITMMSGWLTGWGKPVPEAMGGMDMGGTMPGMMSAQALKQLTAAKGTAFDTMFLTMMISHHEGAITMAKTQIAKGASADAVTLAKKITADQTAQIKAMRVMLGKA